MSWEKSPNLSLGERAEMLTTVDMHPCVVKSSSLDKEKYISFQIPCNSGAVLPQRMPLQVPVDISAEEVGAKERKRELLTIHTHTVMFLPLHCLILLSKLSYRLPFTLGFIGSIVGTIYVSMVLHSYVLSVLFSVVQVLALSYYAISYFPGGSAGMKFLSSTLTSSILRCFGRLEISHNLRKASNCLFGVLVVSCLVDDNSEANAESVSSASNGFSPEDCFYDLPYNIGFQIFVLRLRKTRDEIMKCSLSIYVVDIYFD